MKTNIILNIGLESSTGRAVELHHAIHEIERAGVACLASGVVVGQWQGKEEQTLVICGLCFDSPELLPRLYMASRALSQHCIAVWRDGKGELVGEETNFVFDPSLFHFHPRESKPELSECEAMQAKHKAKARKIEAAGFIGWLETTLIPDLKESGSDATAEDFETLIAHYRNNAETNQINK